MNLPGAAEALPGPLRRALRVAGVGRGLLRTREIGQWVFDRLHARQKYAAFRRSHEHVLRPALYPSGPLRRALVVTKANGGAVQIELALIKGLQMAGFEPTVLTERSDLERYYRMAGATGFVHWDRFGEPPRREQAEALLAGVQNLEDLLAIESRGARVGRFAASSTLRSRRLGRVDLTDPVTRRTLTGKLAEGLALAATSHRLLDWLEPDVAMFLGNRYAGQAELLDVCLERGVDVLAWYYAHCSDALTLKRYGLANRDDHHASVSDDTWRMLLRLPWTEARKTAVRRELHDAYAAGAWYRRGATQVNKKIVDADALRRQLQLDPAKPTAAIFPHIVWDATLWWGTDLFADYEEWLIETVRAACANDRVNWLIKIHPAHVMKAIGSADPEPAEVRILRTQLGPLPPHVKLILPDTAINTYSLFPVMDYCITVRGTIGIEAACLGIRVLTAGTGRYDHRGFTLDADDPEQYLQCLRSIERVPPMTAAEQTLAERYAYGAFVCRPWRLTTWAIDHGEGGEMTLQVGVNARSAAEIQQAADMRAFAAWAADGSQHDFLDRDDMASAEATA